VVVFRPEHGFHRDQVGQSEVLGRLGTIAQEVFDRKVTLRVDTDHRAEEEDAMQRRVQEKVAPDQKQRLQKRAQENPHLGRLLDSLGGSDKEES
jgi:hypothetical protein